MAKLGEINELLISRKNKSGYYLAWNSEEVFLPGPSATKEMQENDTVEVFVYSDHRGRPIATMRKPLGVMGDLVGLKVLEVNQIGAFLDWGIEKDLFVPFAEQEEAMKVGQKYVVKIVMDYKTNRIIGTSKVKSFLSMDPSELSIGQRVHCLIYKFTDLGVSAIINRKYLGLIYANQIFEDLEIGNELDAYIQKIRDDQKIDLRLQPIGVDAIDDARDAVIQALIVRNGYLPLHDKSDPEEIKDTLAMSKKVFKKAIGGLYKEKLIMLETNGIRLLEK